MDFRFPSTFSINYGLSLTLVNSNLVSGAESRDQGGSRGRGGRGFVSTPGPGSG